MPEQEVEILRKGILFKHLNDAEIIDIYRSAIKEHYSSGSIIFQEGEIGSCLYVILSGSVRVYTYDKHGGELVLARLEEGAYLGEQALLSAKPLRRNASVRALSDTILLSLSYMVFRRQLMPNNVLVALLRKEGEKQLINKLVKQLESEPLDSKKLLALFSHKQHFLNREIIFRQGSKAKNAYYLIQGLVEIRTYHDDGKVKLRREIHPGQFFGERDILEHALHSSYAVSLTDTEVFVIDETSFQEAYQHNPALKSFMNAVTRIYQITNFGMMMQYQGVFLKQPAIYMVIQKQDGEIIIASHVLHANIFSITYADVKGTVVYSFENKKLCKIREIKLLENCLVSVISIGPWEDLDEICRVVYKKSKIQAEQLASFIQSGKLYINFPVSKAREGNLCNCMQISYQQIYVLVQQGNIDLETISAKSGAGTVCGGCIPYLQELLGVDVWKHVKISNIREHTKNIRTYQLELLNQQVIPPYQAGKHIVIGANIENYWVDRSYTLTSTATQATYEITVKFEPQGVFSHWLFYHAKPDVILRISEPQGSFIFDANKKQPAICFVAGIGVTPAIAFAKKIIAENRARLLYIDYSVRFEEDIIFQNELIDWPKKFPNIIVHVRITSREGHVQNNIDDILKKYLNADFYICGPVGFKNAVTQHLQTAGIALEQIFLEHFINAGGNLEGKRNEKGTQN